MELNVLCVHVHMACYRLTYYFVFHILFNRLVYVQQNTQFVSLYVRLIMRKYPTKLRC